MNTKTSKNNDVDLQQYNSTSLYIIEYSKTEMIYWHLRTLFTMHYNDVTKTLGV
jgi:hypothetical protein